MVGEMNEREKINEEWRGMVLYLKCSGVPEKQGLDLAKQARYAAKLAASALDPGRVTVLHPTIST